MRFSAVVALMAAVSVSARALPRAADLKALQARTGTLSDSLEVRAVGAQPAAAAKVAAAAKAPKKAKSKKGSKGKGAASSALGGASKSSAADAAAASAAAAAAAAASNSTSVDASASNSTAVDDSASANSTASATSTANSATRTRPCDQGDQSLAAGLNAAVVIGMGQQAGVITAQQANATADFTDAVTRLQQFTDTMALQLQMAAAIADDGSFAQKQLKLLAASQTAQATAVKALAKGDAKTNAAALTSLLASFATSTNNAQDGAEQALIDCFLPLNTLSG